jgi:virginiamycin B lyase
VPTPRSFPHDPLAAAGGSIWYTGQMTSTLGRLDWTKTPNSGPHGLAADKDGNIWFTASSQGYIGKLDPKTGTITEYHLPNPAACNACFRPNGGPLVHRPATRRTSLSSDA